MTISYSKFPPKKHSAPELKSESLLSQQQDDLHEGQISYTHGFVPFVPPTEEFPPEFKAWDELIKNLSSYIAQGSERKEIQKLPLLDASDVTKLPNRYLARASSFLGNAAHAYYYNQRLGFNQSLDPLPECIRRPWEEVNARIGRKLPRYEPGKLKAIRGSYDAFFSNVEIHSDLANGIDNSKLTLDHLSVHMPMFKNNAERVFVLTIMLMELRFAPALKAIIDAIKAVAIKDDIALLKALKKITEVIESVSAALDYLSPNEHSKNYCDPTIWSKTIATFDGEIPGGLPGLSASVFPLFHVLDSFIEREKYDSHLGKAFVEKYKAQPQPIFKFIATLREELTQFPLRSYIEKSSNSHLKTQYQAMMDAYLGEKGLTNIHAVKAYGYLKINFRSGRLETNGRQRSTATVEKEEQRQTLRDFSSADMERKNGYVPKPHYATKLSVTTLSDAASEIILDVSEAGLSFLPGDHCAVLPTNTDEEIETLIQDHKLDPKLEVKLNDGKIFSLCN